MLIFNKNAISSNKISNVSKKNGKGKKTKKVYKSIGKRQKCSYSCKSVGSGQPRKSEVRKKISKKNTQFLEGLGLKVKQNQQ